MRRLNKTTRAPMGTAFFLFVSLAIIPVSLKAAGLDLGLTPRLSAAIDIWSGVASVFGPNYGGAGGSELAALIIPDASPSAASEETCPQQQYACLREADELYPSATTTEIATMPTASTAQLAKAPRVLCELASRNRANNKLAESNFAPPEIPAEIPAEIKVNVDADARIFRALERRKVDATMQREWLSRVERIINPRTVDHTWINPLPVPKSFRMLIRMKQSATSSVTGAECKARAALEAGGRLERASLNSTPAAPDNCDL